MSFAELSTITSLARQNKKPWRTNIFINGEFWKACDTDTVIELGLHEGQRLDLSELDEVGDSLDKRRAINRAVLLLSYRARSKSEITDRLAKAGFAPEIITEAISALERLNYIDDDSFTESWIKSRTKSRSFGSRRIKQELKSKGVSDEVIARNLEQFISHDEEYERAKTLAVSKLATYKDSDKESAFRRLSQFLLRRGYSSSITYDVCKEVLSEWPA